jgi:glycosyltransferase involved in cell wall biosynthesis
VHDRYGTPWDRLHIVPCSIDLDRFDLQLVSAARIEAIRQTWGVARDTKVVLVAGRLVRRKGHHVVVKAAQRLEQRGA